MERAKVTVIIPAYNAADTLREAVESVLKGSYQNFEILIVDDCSRDQTAEISQQLVSEDNRIQYYKNPQNYGVSKSRNLMMERATGKYIAFLDSDDTWEPKKLEICIQYLQDNPDIKSVGHALRYLDMKGNKISYIAAAPTTKEEMKNLKHNGWIPVIFPSSLVVETETLQKEQGFAEDWDVGEDMELFARLANYHGLMALSEPLGNYRLRSGSLTDKRWFRKRIAYGCVQENMERRSRGEPEMKLADYEANYFQNTPWLERMNRMRELLSSRYIRKSGEAWLSRDVIRTIAYGTMGTALNPVESLLKVKRLFLK